MQDPAPPTASASSSIPFPPLPSASAPTATSSTINSPSLPPTSTRPRRSPSKPQTPKSQHAPVQAATPAPGSASGSAPASASGFVGGVRRPSSESKRIRQTFTTCRSYPEYAPAVPMTFVEMGAELQRSQRRSKVEAISKLDRGGMPITLASGPAATSFLPAPAQGPSSLPPAPSPARNPLHRPVTTNPPFKMETVRTEAPRHPPPRTKPRMFGLEDCPVFYPTEDEFRDPLGYIESIGPEAKPYGICKIVPPEGWKMPFSLESDTFRFKTRLQRLNSLEAASRAKLNFLEQLTMYHLQQGDSEVTIPTIDRKPVDLWRLRKEVTKLGGFEDTDRLKAWSNLAETLGFEAQWGNHMRKAYAEIILPFDKFANRAKSGSGSPLTPLTNNGGASGTKPPPPGWTAESPASPTKQGRMSGMRAIPTRMGAAPTTRSSASASPFIPATPTALGGVQIPERASSAAAALPTLKIKVPGFSSREGTESDLSDDSLSPPPPVKVVPKGPSKDDYQKGEVCEICGGGHAADKILLCDGCDRGFHTYCLDPPLAAVPTNEEWFCTPCLLSQGDDYGFEEGDEHSIPSFQARDAAFSYEWWNKHRPVPSGSTPSGGLDPLGRRFGKAFVSEDDVEREFWRLTESSTDTVEVEYGADVHSTTHGSAAPTLETHPLNPYAADGWNLNNMPILPESLLRYIKSDISGMTVPWIYIGMLFSAFCWHNEDHYTYSVNYMFWGETKTWYGIPGEDAYKFEAAMKSEAPELFEQQPGLLFQLVTMMNPGRLKEEGVRVVACDQRPNEFVITFPKAYHCGFNHGINFNEAVNFALPDWLPDGKECVVRYKEHAKPPVFSHNELLITITLYSETIKTALWLQESLAEMVEEETVRRDRLREQVPMLVETLEEEDCPEEQYQCCVCKGFCYLSQVVCSCTKLVACVDHAEKLCGCDKSKRSLRKRYSEAQLEEILEAVVVRAAQPEAWRTRLYSLLEAPRPQLKSLRTLLADGEKIAYPLPEVEDLRAIVARANAWVERVTALASRKSTGRRRKGKHDEEEEEQLDRSPETLSALLREAERLAFDAPEILQLRQMLLSIQNFRHEANLILSTPEPELDLEKCRTALILGNSLNIELPELAQIQTIVNRLTWFRKVEEEVDDRTIQYPEVVSLLEEAEECEIPADHTTIIELKKREAKGRAWKVATDRLLASKAIRLEEVDALVEGQELTPTILDLMRELENIRKKATDWQASARAHLTGSGTAKAADRLCKAIKNAEGSLGKVVIPEIALLQEELDFHEKWTSRLADFLGVVNKGNRVQTRLGELLVGVKNNLAPSDDRPNENYSCFCRGPPQPIMVQCGMCRGSYHPRCAGVNPKNAANPFKCNMCKHEMIDDRPSLVELAYLSDTHRWNFIFPPIELAALAEIIDRSVRFATITFPVADPHNDAVPVRDFELIAHLARKLFTLGICFDAINAHTNERVVLEDWLFKRLHDARNPAKARTRPRKSKLILAESNEGAFGCVCKTPPLDAPLVVRCNKCAQTYHMSCVRAPAEAHGADAKSWRCPCCSVKEGKHYLRAIEVRVQMQEHLGTDIYVDYRTTINLFKPEPVLVTLPPAQHIRLVCTKFIPPIIPDDFEPPTAATPASAQANGQAASAKGTRNGSVGASAQGTPSEGREASGEPKPKKRRVRSVSSKVQVPRLGDVEIEVVNSHGGAYDPRPGRPAFLPGPGGVGRAVNGVEASTSTSISSSPVARQGQNPSVGGGVVNHPGTPGTVGGAGAGTSTPLRPTDVYRPTAQTSRPTPRSILDAQPGQANAAYARSTHPWAPPSASRAIPSSGNVGIGLASSWRGPSGGLGRSPQSGMSSTTTTPNTGTPTAMATKPASTAGTGRPIIPAITSPTAATASATKVTVGGLVPPLSPESSWRPKNGVESPSTKPSAPFGTASGAGPGGGSPKTTANTATTATTATRTSPTISSGATGTGTGTSAASKPGFAHLARPSVYGGSLLGSTRYPGWGAFGMGMGMGLGEVTMGGNGFMNLAVPKVHPGQSGQPDRAHGASNGIKPNVNSNANAAINANASTNAGAGASASTGVSATPKLETDGVAPTRSTPPQTAQNVDNEKTASIAKQTG